MRRMLFLGVLALAACGRREFGEPCDLKDDDCKGGLHCSSVNPPGAPHVPQCTADCEVATDCPDPGGVCWDFGQCSRACDGLGDDSCPPGTACDGQLCVPACENDAQCQQVNAGTCPVPGGLCSGEG